MSGAKTTLTTLRARTKKKTNAKQRQAEKECKQPKNQITANKPLVGFTTQGSDATKEMNALICIQTPNKKTTRTEKTAETKTKTQMMMIQMMTHSMIPRKIKSLETKSTTGALEERLKRRRAKF